MTYFRSNERHSMTSFSLVGKYSAGAFVRLFSHFVCTAHGARRTWRDRVGADSCTAQHGARTCAHASIQHRASVPTRVHHNAHVRMRMRMRLAPRVPEQPRAVGVGAKDTSQIDLQGGHLVRL